jgi:peptidoglycan/xylan/chitin deacetylase (PgdA/CDA1 family)
LDNRRKRERVCAWSWWCLLAAGCAALWAFGGRVPGAPWAAAAALALGTPALLVRTRSLKIPVLNYHSVSDRPGWLQIGDRISIPPSLFEAQLAWLQRRGYTTLFVSELHALLAGDVEPEPGRRYVALTFDDGYADNWVAAFPLLKKFGMKATVFASADFVEDEDRMRPVTDEGAEASDWEGYLTWSEMRAMRESGLVEIQSHGGAHTRVFAEPAVSGFVSPGRPNLWIFLDARPALRSRWWRHLRGDSALWGHPVFAQRPAFTHRAFVPDARAVEHMLAWARERSGAFFERPDWEAQMLREWKGFADAHGDRSQWESDEDFERRVRGDLLGARERLEAGLGSKVEFLCWPESACTPETERIAREAGYRATVSNGHPSLNIPRDCPDRIARVFVGNRCFGVESRRADVLAFALSLKVFEGWYILYPALAAASASRKLWGRRKRERTCSMDYYTAWA